MRSRQFGSRRKGTIIFAQGRGTTRERRRSGRAREPAAGKCRGGKRSGESENVEGKKNLDDFDNDLGFWDVLLLQEVTTPFDAQGHMLVVSECAYRCCVVVVHQRLGASVVRWSDLGRFPEVTVKRKSGESICFVSVYLPHARSLQGSWLVEFQKWESQAKEVRRRGETLICGSDFNQDKIVAALSRSVPQAPVADAEAALCHVEAFLRGIDREGLCVVMPQDGFQCTHHPYAPDQVGRTLDHFIVPAAFQNSQVHLTVLPEAVCRTSHVALELCLK